MAAEPGGASLAIVRVAVICVAFTTFTSLTAIPAGLAVTVAPATKFAPLSVIGTLPPWAPVEGLTDVRMGIGGFTVKGTRLLVPPLVATVTFATPRAASAAMARVAVICDGTITVTLPTVIPALPTATV